MYVIKNGNNDHVIKENTVSIKLTNFQVTIEIKPLDDKNVYYLLHNHYGSELASVLIFYSYEEVVSFCYNVVDKCTKPQEIVDKYMDLYKNGMLKKQELDVPSAPTL